jgi:hypothetical protein
MKSPHEPLVTTGWQTTSTPEHVKTLDTLNKAPRAASCAHVNAVKVIFTNGRMPGCATQAGLNCRSLHKATANRTAACAVLDAKKAIMAPTVG